jgi:hypothetical protein
VSYPCAFCGEVGGHRSECIDTRIRHLVGIGALEPGCPGCESSFEAVKAGKDLPFMPHHKPSSRCESGRYPHCSCDTCF